MKILNPIITSTIQSLYNSDYSPDITPAPKAELGEYCINVFPLAKTAWKAPNIISAEIATELAKHTDIFTSTNATGGYVNFFLTDRVWIDMFQKLPLQREYREAGRDFVSEENPQKTIVVDYIGANVGKPLHIGHICTPSIGQVICNVYHHLGYRVIGDSHFGDWGGIFGKLIYWWKEYAKLEWEDQNFIRLNQFWVQYLLDIYQWIHNKTWNASISEVTKVQAEELERNCRTEFQYLSWVGIDLSDPEERKHHEENVELWKKFTSISIAETEKKLSLLNVEATYNIGESFYEGLGLPRPNGEDYPDLEYNMKSIVAELIEKKVATQNDDGSVGVIFPEESKLPSCILQKKDGTGLYLTSDLAAIKYRLTNGWNPSKIIYSVDVRQQLHLKQAFTIAQMAWPELTRKVEFFHAFNGFIKLKEWAMSTRHGTVIFLEALIEEWFERTQSILAEKWRSLEDSDIQAITIAAIKYSYLAQDREKDVTFDWDKALNFEGNSGPYIQYAYVRASKILSEAEGDVSSIPPSMMELSTHDKSLIQMLSAFDEKVNTVATSYKPHHLALYAYDLAVIFNSFYVHTPKILEEKNTDIKQFRLALIKKTTATLKKSFELLGIEMPSEM